ncbi:hypothetical protein A6U84_25855 (plasmid) [Agrobacterium sp. 13-2099-1-2]|uniref:hypothetical protein n=1 Tax=Agrobacterium sp. 13-2099-1-2 TaxID=1841651 RepID=UPI00080FB041|nr:hypothetical protein [Agrobacterium sp. 13-2099-1-2]UZX45498.1 hypothetical protein A6U84_25855 [Agrobacterium sp. 13-2099-1-2]
MRIRQYLLEKHGVYAKSPLDDGDFVGAKKASHDDLDPRIIAEVDRDSDLTVFTGYVATELLADDDDIPTVARTEILFSQRKGISAVYYDHPNISDAFIEWVFCSSAEDALDKWKKKVRWPLIETSRGSVDIFGDAHL